MAVIKRTLKVTHGEDLWLLDPTEIGPDGEFAGCLFQPKYGELERFDSFAALFHDSRRLL